MNSEEFKLMYFCEFAPDKRDIEIDERLELYYQQTPMRMGNRTAMSIKKEFNDWCICRGYTREDIRKSKRRVNATRRNGE